MIVVTLVVRDGNFLNKFVLIKFININIRVGYINLYISKVTK